MRVTQPYQAANLSLTVVSARIGAAGEGNEKMPIQRIWIAAFVCLICLSNLSEGHAQFTDELDELILEQAPSEPREVRVGGSGAPD